MRPLALGALAAGIMLLAGCTAGDGGAADDSAGGAPSMSAEAVKQQTDDAAAEVVPALVDVLDAEIRRMEARFDSCSAGKRYEAATQLRALESAVPADSGSAAVADLLEEGGWVVETDDGAVIGSRGDVQLQLSAAEGGESDDVWSTRELAIETSCRIYPDGDALEDVAAVDYADLVR